MPSLPRMLLVCLLVLSSCGKSSGGLDASAEAGRSDARAGDAGDGGASAMWDASPVDEDVPPVASEDLKLRGRHLLDAIVQNNPDLAHDILYPRDVWIAARDVKDAPRQYDKKVGQPFKRAIARLHKKKGIARAQFVALEVGRSISSVKPKRGGYKRSAWVVRGSALVFTIDGKSHRVPIREMVGVRGVWYVTALR